MNVAQVLHQMASQRGAAPALIDVRDGRDRVLTFAQLEAAEARVAEQIAAAGVSRGDAVLILHPPAIELYIFLMALFRIGAVAVILDPSAGWHHVAIVLAWLFAIPGVCFGWYAAVTYVPMGRRALTEGRSQRHTVTRGPEDTVARS